MKKKNLLRRLYNNWHNKKWRKRYVRVQICGLCVLLWVPFIILAIFMCALAYIPFKIAEYALEN